VNLSIYYCPIGFSNAYILGSDPPARDAIVIDPGAMSAEMLMCIEDHEYALRGVFITHDHLNHDRGLPTLTRIYDTDVYAAKPVVRDRRATLLRDGDVISLGSFTVEVIAVPGHSPDSVIFKIRRMLFTGDALSAGLVGSTANAYAEANQMAALRGKIMSLPGDYIVLPGHGPPSSLDAERRFNDGLAVRRAGPGDRAAGRSTA